MEKQELLAMKFVIRTVCKMISAISGSLEEIRYECGEHRETISKVNKTLLDARSTLQRILEQ